MFIMSNISHRFVRYDTSLTLFLAEHKAMTCAQRIQNPQLWHEHPARRSRADGTRLHIDCGQDLGLEFEELDRLPTYRRLYHLHSLQTGLIARLTIERDFYRRECHQQAQFGMVIIQLFGP